MRDAGYSGPMTRCERLTVMRSHALILHTLRATRGYNPAKWRQSLSQAMGEHAACAEPSHPALAWHLLLWQSPTVVACLQLRGRRMQP